MCWGGKPILLHPQTGYLCLRVRDFMTPKNSCPENSVANHVLQFQLYIQTQKLPTTSGCHGTYQYLQQRGLFSTQSTNTFSRAQKRHVTSLPPDRRHEIIIYPQLPLPSSLIVDRCLRIASIRAIRKSCKIQLKYKYNHHINITLVRLCQTYNSNHLIMIMKI